MTEAAIDTRSEPGATPGQRLDVALGAPLELKAGGVLPDVNLRLETWGQRNPADDNTVLLFTGLSTDAHATSGSHDPRRGWWEYMIGPGRPIDTDVYHVVCVNSLGSCFGSTGPASPRPDGIRPWGTDFPELAIEDIADSAHLALAQLGIRRIDTVVGVSLGGMTALAHAVRHPGAMDRLVTVSSAARASAFAIGVRSLQREIIRHDPAWDGGDYVPGRGPREGMRLARKLGMLSYRAMEEWNGRFDHARIADAPGDDPWAAEFQIEGYLEANARKFVDRFDANSYLYLSRAMDRFDIAEYGVSVAAGLDRAGCRRSLVVGVESDFLFPLAQQRELADGLPGSRFEALASPQGHDAFLVDEERFAPVVAEFMASTRGGATS